MNETDEQLVLTEKQGEIVVITFNVSVIINELQSSEFKNQLFSIFEDKSITKVIVDFSKVHYIKSLGVSIILALKQKLIRDNINFRFCSTNEHVAKTIKLTRLDRGVEVCNTLASAVESFSE